VQIVVFHFAVQCRLKTPCPAAPPHSRYKAANRRHAYKTDFPAVPMPLNQKATAAQENRTGQPPQDKTMKKLNTLFAATLLVAAFSAHAAPAYTPAPNQVKQVKTQAPGYFRQMVGDFEVTALYD